MFSKSVPNPPARAAKGAVPGLSFVGPEVVIKGDLTTGSQLHLDGRIDGHVQCGQLCLGGSGVISGDISADEARIAGLVEGSVLAKNLTVEASAKVRGDITYETISIAAGAQIDGRLARREALSGATGSAPLLVATKIADPAPEPKKNGASDFFPLPEGKQAAAG